MKRCQHQTTAEVGRRQIVPSLLLPHHHLRQSPMQVSATRFVTSKSSRSLKSTGGRESVPVGSWLWLNWGGVAYLVQNPQTPSSQGKLREDNDKSFFLSQSIIFKGSKNLTGDPTSQASEHVYFWSHSLFFDQTSIFLKGKLVWKANWISELLVYQ